MVGCTLVLRVAILSCSISGERENEKIHAVSVLHPGGFCRGRALLCRAAASPRTAGETPLPPPRRLRRPGRRHRRFHRTHGRRSTTQALLRRSEHRLAKKTAPARGRLSL